MWTRARKALISLVVLLGVAAASAAGYVRVQTERLDAEAQRFLKKELHARLQAQREISRPGEMVGSLLIPRLNTQTMVVEGTGKRELDIAPGHLSGTPLPGQKGNAVIAGHRDSHFRSLRHVREGDVVFVETGGEIHTYRVVNQTIVSPTDTHVIDPTQRPTLTLITCYPFYFVGHAPSRYILRAELIS